MLTPCNFFALKVKEVLFIVKDNHRFEIGWQNQLVYYPKKWAMRYMHQYYKGPFSCANNLIFFVFHFVWHELFISKTSWQSIKRYDHKKHCYEVDISRWNQHNGLLILYRGPNIICMAFSNLILPDLSTYKDMNAYLFLSFTSLAYTCVATRFLQNLCLLLSFMGIVIALNVTPPFSSTNLIPGIVAVYCLIELD